jgi:hypothetical protein
MLFAQRRTSHDRQPAVAPLTTLQVITGVSVRHSKKAWLVAVVLSIGKAMNDQPDVKAGELYVADANMETHVAYFLPIDLARSLQKEVSAGQMKLGAMYEEIQKNLVRKALPKP